MRWSSLAASCALAGALVGCVSSEPTATTCGDLRFAAPVLVHEYRLGDPTSGLGRLGEDGCFTEIADISLPGNATLLAAREEQSQKPFLADNDQGLLHALDESGLKIEATFVTYEEGEIQGQRVDLPNPHGVDVDAKGRLWVARYGMGSLAILTAGGGFDAAIDLSDLDPDGVPEMEAVRVASGRVYVALELLDRKAFPIAARRSGLVAVLDEADGHRLGLIDLVGKNPFGRFVSLGAEGTTLAIATPGSFDAIDASDGIDAIELATGKARQVISESALGGSVLQAVFASETEAYAIVLGPEPGVNPTRVVRFDPTTAELRPIDGLPDASSFVYTSLALVGDALLVADGTRDNAKIVVVDRASGEVRGAVLPKLSAPWALLPLSK